MTTKSNVEIKARVRDPATIRAQLQVMDCTESQLLEQEDIFFFTRRGRLKLRIFSPQRGELIYYERSDKCGPRESRYLLAPCSAPEASRALLGAALGIRGIVHKRRELYLLGQTRIHLDEVDRLGSFLELEVVLTPGQSAEEGQHIVRNLLARLNIDESALIDCAYIDLLDEQENEGEG